MKTIQGFYMSDFIKIGAKITNCNAMYSSSNSVLHRIKIAFVDRKQVLVGRIFLCDTTIVTQKQNDARANISPISSPITSKM